MLTTQQKLILKTWLLANAQAMNDQQAADALNAQASPAYVVWRSSVTDKEIMQNGFDWTRVDNLSVGKARVWDWMFRFGVINPSQANIRAGIEQVWVGTAADLAVRTAVYSHCKRNATLAEKLLAAGTGSDALPATMGFQGLISAQDVVDSYNS